MGRDKENRKQWDKENTEFIGIRLMKSTDADIIEYIDKKTEEGETKQGVIKRSLRYTMEAEGFSMSDGGEVQEPAQDYAMVADHKPEYKAKKEQ